MSTHVHRYETLSSFLDIAEKTKLDNSDDYWHGNDWDLGVKAKEAISRARSGDMKIAAQMIDALTHTDELPNAPDWVRSVAGAFPVIPEFLGGAPDCMRRRAKAKMRHINIYVEISAICNIKASDMLARGTAVLGLLEAYQAQNIAVDLFLTCDSGSRHGGDLMQVIPVESKPLDLSTAGFAIAHPAFARSLVYKVSDVNLGFDGQCSRARLGNDNEAYDGHVRSLLGLDPHDIFLPEIKPWDPMLANPRLWIENLCSGKSSK